MHQRRSTLSGVESDVIHPFRQSVSGYRAIFSKLENSLLRPTKAMAAIAGNAHRHLLRTVYGQPVVGRKFGHNRSKLLSIILTTTAIGYKTKRPVGTVCLVGRIGSVGPIGTAGPVCIVCPVSTVGLVRTACSGRFDQSVWSIWLVRQVGPSVRSVRMVRSNGPFASFLATH